VRLLITKVVCIAKCTVVLGDNISLIIESELNLIWLCKIYKTNC